MCEPLTTNVQIHGLNCSTRPIGDEPAAASQHASCRLLFCSLPLPARVGDGRGKQQPTPIWAGGQEAPPRYAPVAASVFVSFSIMPHTCHATPRHATPSGRRFGPPAAMEGTDPAACPLFPLSPPLDPVQHASGTKPEPITTAATSCRPGPIVLAGLAPQVSSSARSKSPTAHEGGEARRRGEAAGSAWYLSRPAICPLFPPTLSCVPRHIGPTLPAWGDQVHGADDMQPLKGSSDQYHLQNCR
ncbi:hypothetical protein XA68_17197 [Ophiocordyceps unilateralis]|uniref:Uncharacterized protein n=1 Tax=Ophiocordyceps unilateralis TaxID=268505 RepID=A0A2A9P4B2_OPHUN|nr:hypothetical protein XA68_17197 [Ophiocordyceps unilateralis]